jgi:hypothetical protein
MTVQMHTIETKSILTMIHMMNAKMTNMNIITKEVQQDHQQDHHLNQLNRQLNLQLNRQPDLLPEPEGQVSVRYIQVPEEENIT